MRSSSLWPSLATANHLESRVHPIREVFDGNEDFSLRRQMLHGRHVDLLVALLLRAVPAAGHKSRSGRNTSREDSHVEHIQQNERRAHRGPIHRSWTISSKNMGRGGKRGAWRIAEDSVDRTKHRTDSTDPTDPTDHEADTGGREGAPTPDTIYSGP